ncbi:hypothetical protein DFJ77DRAFT_514305 [Powellomyces hirtus]|nr:hypothetical protein DFJ77DRAFT_514305 [Powellomyces hirtus]
MPTDNDARTEEQPILQPNAQATQHNPPSALSMLLHCFRTPSTTLHLATRTTTSVLVKAHITILRLLVTSALLFALIPVLALVAALAPPPAPAWITVISACTIFPTATITLWLAVKKMREEEMRVRWAADQLEMGNGGLPRYVDVEPLPPYVPKDDNEGNDQSTL